MSTRRFADNAELTSLAAADVLPLEQMSDEKDKKVTFGNLNKQILHNAAVECEVNEDDATLKVTLKDQTGAEIDSDEVELPNTGTLAMEVDEDTAELTVQLKNTRGEVVTEDTVELPNTSDLEMTINESNVLTTSLKDKTGAVVTSDSVTIPTIETRNVTREQYDALPDSKLTDGVYYNIIESNEVPEDETINGNKNFTGTVKVKGNEVVTKAEYKQVRETIVNYTYTNKGAGASGFITLNLPQGHSVALNNIIAVISQTGTISGSYGLQFTYVYISGDIVYMNYYQPKAISESVDIVFRIKYFK